MNIVLVHNYYQTPGGEDLVFNTEANLLEERGHSVHRYTVHNDDIAHMNRLALAAGTVWRRSEARRMRALFRQIRPNLVHFHNTFPLISPAAYYAAHNEGVPVVQTLHNYRLLCVDATLFRNGHTCEDCLNKVVSWPGMLHGCYRSSRAASTVVTGMLAVHRALGTWQNKVDRWIALSNFARDKFVQGGLPAHKFAVKPNFVPDPGCPDHRAERRRDGLFVGRLTDEKGLSVLLSACRGLDLCIDVLGDGRLAKSLQHSAPENVRFHGYQHRDAIFVAMRTSGFLVVPSIWYEGFPMVLVEAFANGLPVIASRLGALAEIVEDGVTGLHFEPGSPEDLAAKLQWADSHPEELRRMGQNARRTYEDRYSPTPNYQQLIQIYDEAIEEKRSRSCVPSENPLSGSH